MDRDENNPEELDPLAGCDMAPRWAALPSNYPQSRSLCFLCYLLFKFLFASFCQGSASFCQFQLRMARNEKEEEGSRSVLGPDNIDDLPRQRSIRGLRKCDGSEFQQFAF